MEATKAYGAEVVLHGTIWDEANEKAQRARRTSEGLTYVHPFDDLELIAGQGTLGLEIVEDPPDVDTVVVPIGGGGLISGVSSAVKSIDPDDPGDRRRVVRRAGNGAQRRRRDASSSSTRSTAHRRPQGEARGRARRSRSSANASTRSSRFPTSEIFEAVLWAWHDCKLVVEGAAAAPVAALLNGLVEAPEGSKVVVRSQRREHRPRAAARPHLELTRRSSFPQDKPGCMTMRGRPSPRWFSRWSARFSTSSSSRTTRGGQ